MVLAVPLPYGPKTFVWALALAWMGGACLLNARRCGRVHCRFTGPFLLTVILPVLGRGAGLLPPGDEGWRRLGLAIGGTAALWWISERAMGRYR